MWPDTLPVLGNFKFEERNVIVWPSRKCSETCVENMRSVVLLGSYALLLMFLFLFFTYFFGMDDMSISNSQILK